RVSCPPCRCRQWRCQNRGTWCVVRRCKERGHHRLLPFSGEGKDGVLLLTFSRGSFINDVRATWSRILMLRSMPFLLVCLMAVLGLVGPLLPLPVKEVMLALSLVIKSGILFFLP